MQESPRTSLLLSGADAGLRDSTGVSPIDLAVDHSQDKIVVALAQKGVDLEGADEPSLESAVGHNHFSTVRVLLAVGANANPVSDHVSYTTVLQFAAYTDNAAAIPVVIEAGANVESADLHDETPLFSAATHGSCAAMRAILQLGADIDAKK
ncbi:inversin protein alternative isoform [Ectocarpus siliculosus]|uniref:Inversin protein alternative isoform n=1 Tax=Ectocarpus siliculosus TaxID=2880 RepID=D7G2A8_ECTSI|nr:inversin protein alternative isoform [Ectocarpus siliculosus]|eukprot:CBJ48785.1 inversin protein alternative isoform [Ectocarpus siliculosus]